MNNKNKTVLFLVIALLLMSFGGAVENDTQVDLKTVCTDLYGNICTDQAYLTVIDPDNITLFNNSLCVNVAVGVYSCGFYANKTGVWWASVNFTNQNLSREFNVVVEENKLADIWTISLTLGITALLFILFYVSLKLTKDHKYLSFFFFLIGIILISLLVFIMKSITQDVGIGNALDTVYKISVYLPYLVIAYFLALIFYQPIKGLMEKVRGLRGGNL